jgi:serine/threonine protein kinase
MPDGPTEVVVYKEGIEIAGELVALPNHSILGEIGRGANGVVVLCEHKLIGRREAIKIWLKLKPGDKRDKFKQGIEEARKAISAAGNYVPQIYAADVLQNRYFYVSMEPISGMTIAAYLKQDYPYTSGLHRGAIARSYFRALSALNASALIHGDPHMNNALVRGPVQRAKISLTLLDFGTSHFTSPRNFRRRHWAVVHETVSRIFDRHPSYERHAVQIPKISDGAKRLYAYWSLAREMLDLSEKHRLELFGPTGYRHANMLDDVKLW